MPGAFDKAKGLPGTQSGTQPTMARSYEPSWRDDIATGWRSLLGKLGVVSPEGRMSPEEERLVGGVTGSLGLTGPLGNTPNIPMVDGAAIAAGLATGGWTGLGASVGPSYSDMVSGLRRDDDDLAMQGAVGTVLSAPALYGLARGVGKVTSAANHPADDALDPEFWRLPEHVRNYLMDLRYGLDDSVYVSPPSQAARGAGAFSEPPKPKAEAYSGYGLISPEGQRRMATNPEYFDSYLTTDLAGAVGEGSPMMLDKGANQARILRERAEGSFDLRPQPIPDDDLPGIHSLPGVEKLAGPNGINIDYADILQRLQRPQHLNSAVGLGVGLGAASQLKNEEPR